MDHLRSSLPDSSNRAVVPIQGVKRREKKDQFPVLCAVKRVETNKRVKRVETKNGCHIVK